MHPIVFKVLAVARRVLILSIAAALGSFATVVVMVNQAAKKGPTPGCVIGYQAVMQGEVGYMVPVELCPNNPHTNT